MTNCSNNGLCKLSSGNKYICECQDDYIGASCQINIRPCTYFPCLNDGICNEYEIDNHFYFNCTCPQKFSGDRCELFSIDKLCENVTCSSKGVCEINQTSLETRCKCFSYYEGENCEIETQAIVIIKFVISWFNFILIKFH